MARAAPWALALAVAVPLVVAAVAALRTTWFPSGDQAIEVLRMHDVGSSHTPFVGAYSRDGWNHPGPLLFWIGASGLWAGGTSGVLAVLTLVSGASAAAGVLAARAVGGAALAWLASVGLALLIASSGPELVDPWNPWVGGVPFAAYLLIVWAAASGVAWSLPVAVLLGSYCAQAHVGYAPIVLLAGLSAAVWSQLRPHGRHTRPRLDRRWVYGSTVVGIACWAAPLWQQVTGDDGNLTAIVAYFRDPATARPSASTAFDVAARELGFPAAWMGSTEDVGQALVRPGSVWTLVVTAAAAVVLCVVSWRRGRRPIAAFLTYAVVLLGGSVLAVSRTTGGSFPYLFRWTWGVGMLVWLAMLWSIWDLARSSLGEGADAPAARRVEVVGAAACAVALGVLILVGAWSAPSWSPPQERQSEAIARLSASVRSALPPGPYRVEWSDPAGFAATSIGLAADLGRHGYDLRYRRDFKALVGDFRVVSGTNGELPLLLVLGSTTPPRPPDGEAQLLAKWDPLTKAERARAIELRADGSPTGAESRSVEARNAYEHSELGRLESRGLAYEVWLVAPQ